MNFDEAKESVRCILNRCNTVSVLEDGTIYVNTDLEAVKSIAGSQKVFSIKPEVIEEVKKPKKLKDE